ncbi:MAG: hypothetical protein FD149_2451 [Rhodospirillaceae bacterium]|nr:MAG: hypothetical protein FD149_2451 [Rhodospirillaceae bacterium]
MHALVLNGHVIQTHDFDAEQPPVLVAQKGVWLPLHLVDAPEYDARTHDLVHQEILYETVVERRPIATLRTDATARLIAAVKADAGRMIVALYPDWKQRNMTARAVALLRKGEANWTAAESAEAAILEAAWAWITAVRTESDAIEADIAALANDQMDGLTWSERWPVPLA